MSDSPLKDCPKCGKEIRRLIFGGAGVIFKGSGFYVTDKGKAAKSGTEKTSAEKSGSEKSETKAEPAAAPTCSNCPNKGASASCPA